MGNRESAIEDHGLVQASYRLRQTLQVRTRVLQITAGVLQACTSSKRVLQITAGHQKCRIYLYRIDRDSAEAVQSPRQASGHE